jgi:PAS domain S-box-containing protein
MLSALFSLVLGLWWDSSESYKAHIAILITTLAVIISSVLVIHIYPTLKRRSQLAKRNKQFDEIAWGQDISTKLSTPAAVIEGYNIKFANNAFLKELGMLGMRDFITDMPLTNLVHPGSHHTLNDIIVQNADNDSNSTSLLRLLYVDGTTLPVTVSISPLGENKQPNQFLLQFAPTSTTELSHALPRDDVHHKVIEEMEQIVFQIDVDQAIIFLNSSWQRMLDFTVDESINNALLNFIHPEDLPLAESRLSSLTEGKRQRCQFELRLITKSGRAHWFEMRASTTSKQKGERSSIIGSMTDINRSKHKSLGLKANATNTNDMILPTIPCMLYRCKNDRNWTVDYVSEGCPDVTEYQRYELTQHQNFNFRQLIHPDDQQRAWDYVQQQITKRRSFHLIYRIVTRSHRVKWVMESGKGIYSGSDELLGLEGVMTDISTDDYTELQLGLNQIVKEQQSH